MDPTGTSYRKRPLRPMWDRATLGLLQRFSRLIFPTEAVQVEMCTNMCASACGWAAGAPIYWADIA